MTRAEPNVDYSRIAPLVAAQLSVLTALDDGPRLPRESRLSDQPTPIMDLNSEVLWWRTPVVSDAEDAAYVDIAAHPALGAPLVAVSSGVVWAPDELVARARESLPAETPEVDEVLFVAYSFPKVAVQFLSQGAEVAMVELYSWVPVPPAGDRRADEPPGNFDRWSYLDETADRREAQVRAFEERLEGLVAVADRLPQVDLRISAVDAPSIIELLQIRTDSRALHFSRVSSDHAPCFELRGQETNQWCVAASVQMVLSFYRYDYSQTRIASDLGLGTAALPTGLPYSQDALVVTVLNWLSNGSLSAAMNTGPTFNQFRSEILANRPLVSFVPGHSRAVAGYTRTTSAVAPALDFYGLLVFDPWPPHAGVVTRWENCVSQRYRVTFSAHVTRRP